VDIPKAITCLIADDHPAMVAAVRDTLEQHGVEVTGVARDGQEALKKLDEHPPAVVLLDVQMPRLSGIEVARELARREDAPAVLLYTAFGDRALLTEAIDAGARGFVLKEAPLADLVRAVELVAAGGTYVDPVLAGVLASPEVTERLPDLTVRERDVLRLLSEGLTNEGIGERLFISPETVRTHIRKAMAKLDADTRTQAVATALRESLIA
jgi:DNA-binding NarL/FixJ family response regulator